MMFLRLLAWTFLTFFRLVKSNRASQNAAPSLRLMYYVRLDSRHWSLLLLVLRFWPVSRSLLLIASG